MEQGREGTTPKRMRAVMDENDNEEGRVVSRGVGKRMSTSGKTRTTHTRQEQPGEIED